MSRYEDSQPPAKNASVGGRRWGILNYRITWPFFHVSNNSAPLGTRAWNARNGIFFASSMKAPTNGAKPTQIRLNKNSVIIKSFWATFWRQYGFLMMMMSITSSISCGRGHQLVKYISRWLSSLRETSLRGTIPLNLQDDVRKVTRQSELAKLSPHQQLMLIPTYSII